MMRLPRPVLHANFYNNIDKTASWFSCNEAYVEKCTWNISDSATAISNETCQGEQSQSKTKSKRKLKENCHNKRKGPKHVEVNVIRREVPSLLDPCSSRSSGSNTGKEFTTFAECRDIECECISDENNCKNAETKKRVSITKDPVNTRKIQKCETAKLQAMRTSSKTGFPFCDIYTGRISFSDKASKTINDRMVIKGSNCIQPRDTENQVGMCLTSAGSDVQVQGVCTSQPVALPALDERGRSRVSFYDSESFSSDWTVSSGSRDDPITLEEIRQNMCYYVLCLGLCFD